MTSILELPTTRADERQRAFFQRKVVDECRDLLSRGRARVTARHWKRNRNSDLFLLEGLQQRWLLKILTSKLPETLETEFRNLEELHRIAGATGAFRVPAPVLFLSGRSAYVMEWVDGDRLDRIFVAGSRDPERIQPLVDRSATALSALHSSWNGGQADDRLTPRRLLLELKSDSFSPSQDEHRLLDRLGNLLRGRESGRTRLYLDFDPVNVLIDREGRPVFLDPPERRITGFPAWDVGTFSFGIRRAAWRSPLSALRFAGIRNRLATRFIRSYEYRSGQDDPVASAILVALSELGRVAQLWSWWLKPFAFRQRIVGIGRAVYAYPLLLRARKERFGEIRRLLDEADGS